MYKTSGNDVKNGKKDETAGRHIIETLEHKILSKRTLPVRAADGLVNYFGTARFFFITLTVSIVWIIINVRLVPGVVPFDPFPFILLTMIASVGAIFMTIVILISQNRQAYINTLRSELLLQMILISERELTKALRLLARQAGASKRTKALDRELAEMLKDTAVSHIEHTLAKQLQNDITP